MSRRTFRDLAVSIPNWKELFQDKDFMMNFAQMIDDERYKNDADPQVVSVLRHWARAFAAANFQTCFNLAESPIERIFLSQLITAFYWYDPFVLVVAPTNLKDFLNKMDRAFDNERKVMKASKESGQLAAQSLLKPR